MPAMLAAFHSVACFTHPLPARCAADTRRLRASFNSYHAGWPDPPQQRSGSCLAADTSLCPHSTCWLTSRRRRPSSRLLLSCDDADTREAGRVPSDASAHREGSLAPGKVPRAGSPNGDAATAPRKRGRPKGSTSKNKERQRTPRSLESAVEGAPAVKAKRGRPKGSKSRKSTDMMSEQAPPPPRTPATARPSGARTGVKKPSPETETVDYSLSDRPRRRISIARAATAANRQAAATEKEAVAEARAEAAAAVAAAVSAAAAATAEAHAGSPAGDVSNSVIFTGRAFSEDASKRAIDDDDLVAAAVAAMKKGGGNRGGRKRGRPPVTKSRVARLSQERAGSRDDASLGSRQQQGDDSGTSDSLLGRAEVDAILSLSGNGVGGGVGVDGGGGKDGGSGGVGAPAVATERHGVAEGEGADEAEEAAALRALMSDVGFREDEVAAYSLGELLLLREELEKEWADAEAAEIALLETTERQKGRRNTGSAEKVEEDTVEIETTDPSWQHPSLSLQERLGLSDEEVDLLRRSPRSGLAPPRQKGDGVSAAVESRMRERMTGRSAGGPQTAVGYLLGELRMRTEEVKDAVLRWPALLSLSKQGPHAVASWLQGGLGLSADDVGKMIKKHPPIVAYSIVHNLRPKLRWLQQEAGLSRFQSVRLVVRCPALFALGIDDNMAPKVEWLQDTLGFSRKQAARAVYANPGILLSSIEGSLMPKISWLVEALQMDEETVFDMIRRFPPFFTLSSEENLAPKLQWLSSHLSNRAIRRVLFRQPSLLGHNADGNLAPKVQWLQDRLGMTEAAAWKFVGRSPGFLTLSVSDNLEPKLWWLRDKLDVSLAGAAKMLTTYPNLFGLSIEASLEPKLWWVRDALGLDRPDAAKILRRCPQIFGSSLKDTLEPKLSWLSVRLKTDRERVASIVKKYPQILAYSIEDNLAPTIDFFEFGMGEVEPSELLDCLEMKPSVLAASLGKRLVTRASRMRRAGIEPKFSRDFRFIAQLTEPKFK
ncbi:unnamed protein product, partial [Scytosiphon promiscuus]